MGISLGFMAGVTTGSTMGFPMGFTPGSPLGFSPGFTRFYERVRGPTVPGFTSGFSLGFIRVSLVSSTRRPVAC